MRAQDQIQNILEAYGTEIANESNKILLKDPKLRKIRPLEFVSKTWRDPLTPAMMSLSCQAVHGDPKLTREIAIAMSLMNLSFRTWDDIIDKTLYRKLNPTTVGKFGNNIALIIGGLASAKAFTILNQANMNAQKRQKINTLIWNYWAKMAEAESIDLKLKSGTYSSKEKFKKIKNEAVNLKTCLKIGATIGNGSLKDINDLGEYGQCLGIIFELLKDIQVSLNLTLELEEKLKNKAIPYSFLIAKERSKTFEKKLEEISKKEIIEPCEIKEVVNCFLQSDSLAYIENVMDEMGRKAEATLDKLVCSKANEVLRTFLQLQTRVFQETLTT